MSESLDSGSEPRDDTEWLPDEYDPGAPLRERLKVMVEIEGGIELHAGDERGVVEVLGSPHEVNETGVGGLELRAGGKPHNWNYEVAVPAEDAGRGAFVRKVDPNQTHEDYIDTRRVRLRDVDVRIYGADHGRLNDRRKEAEA